MAPPAADSDDDFDNPHAMLAVVCAAFSFLPVAGIFFSVGAWFAGEAGVKRSELAPAGFPGDGGEAASAMGMRIGAATGIFWGLVLAMSSSGSHAGF